jgi:prepilin-type processing-associated H-X9-DG protein
MGNTNYGQNQQSQIDAAHPGGIQLFKGAPFGPSTRPGQKSQTPATKLPGSRALAKISDGTSHTLLMAEIRTIKRDTAAGWAGPISEIETALGGQTFEGTLLPNDAHGDGVCRVSCVNGTGTGAESTPITVQEMDGAPPCFCSGGTDRTSIDAQFFAARSKHRGGVNVSACDGSVHFVPDSIDLQIWRALCSAEGGETNATFP